MKLLHSLLVLPFLYFGSVAGLCQDKYTWIEPFAWNEMETELYSWEDANFYCTHLGYDGLATMADYCTALDGQPHAEGDHWAPFSDYSNGWVQVGTAHSLCQEHRPAHGDPAWGLDETHQPFEANHILCAFNNYCEWNSPPPGEANALRNWEDAHQFCLHQGFDRFASFDDIWRTLNGVAHAGGDQWSPISDYPNGWIQIGTSHTLAQEHRPAYGDPAWGIDNVHQPFEANYVLCTNVPPPAPTTFPTFHPTPSPTYECLGANEVCCLSCGECEKCCSRRYDWWPFYYYCLGG